MSQIKVVSWNVYGGKDIKGIVEYLKAEDADIIALQEVMQNCDGSENTAKVMADALGYSYAYATTQTLNPGTSWLLSELNIDTEMDWGNAVISRYPITQNRVHTLSEERKRTALEAVIPNDGGELSIFSTHVAYDPTHTSEIPMTQIRSLIQALPKERSIVLGDFNATPESDLMQEMERVMTNTELDAAAPVTHDGKRIDYIFATNELKVISSGTGESNASDHLPIFATIQI